VAFVNPSVSTRSPQGEAPSAMRVPATHANLNLPRRELGVFALADEIQFGGPNIAVPGNLTHLVHLGTVADGIVDGGLAQRVDADTARAEPVGIDETHRLLS
jgi:hypothetical protein